MTTLTDHPLSTTVPPAPPIAVPPLRERLGKRLSWLKPPFRSIKRLGAWFYNTRSMMRRPQIGKVQIGCGKDIRPGWWNVDFIYFPGVDEIRDATLPWRHKNLRYVFAEHFIEHLTLHQGLMFLRNAGSALAPGGVLRVSTPNLTSVIQKGFQVHGAGREQRLNETIGMNTCFHGYGHQFLYSGEFLRYVLEEMGFEHVREYDFGQSDDPNLHGLERHGPFEVDDGVPNIITFEATRGTRAIAPSPSLRRLLNVHFDGETYR